MNKTSNQNNLQYDEARKNSKIFGLSGKTLLLDPPVQHHSHFTRESNESALQSGASELLQETVPKHETWVKINISAPNYTCCSLKNSRNPRKNHIRVSPSSSSVEKSRELEISKSFDSAGMIEFETTDLPPREQHSVDSSDQSLEERALSEGFDPVDSDWSLKDGSLGMRNERVLSELPGPLGADRLFVGGSDPVLGERVFSGGPGLSANERIFFPGTLKTSLSRVVTRGRDPVTAPSYVSQTREQLLGNRFGGSVSVEVSDISCFKSNTYAKFTAHLRTTRKLLFAPLLEGSKKKCKIQSLGEREYLLDLRGPDFLLCGVRQCNFQFGSEVFCLQLRFQNVKGLLMADDSLLKIECQAHRPKAHQLGRFSIPVEEDRKGEFRSASILARGGDTEPKMESDIFLLRKQGSQFNRLMRPGETLMLGEELMIKTSVRSKNDDDWQFSRMSDVVAQRVSKVNAATQSIDDDSDDTVVIVDTDGCRNPNLNDVCPLDPEQDKDDPLVTTLILRVFMMDSMLDGEELQITLRTTACVEYHDCNPNCLNSGSSWQNKLVRSRRNIPEKTANKNSSIFIKIEVPPGRIQQTKVAISEDDLHNRKPILPVSLICILSLIFAIVYKTIK